MIKNSYYNRLVKINSIIAVFVVLVITALFYGVVWNTLQTENGIRQEADLMQIRDYIDTKLITSYNLLNGFRVDDTIIEFVNNENTNNYNILQVHKALVDESTTFTDLGYTMSISKDGYKRLITPEKTTDVSSYFIGIGESGFLDKFEEGNYGLLNKERIIFNSHLNLDSSGKRESAINIVTKEKTIGNKSFIVFLSFYEKNMFPELADSSDEAFVIVRKKEVLGIGGGINRDIVEKIVAQSMDNELYDGHYEFLNETYRVKGIRSEFIDWQIVSIQRAMPLRNELNYWMFVCTVGAVLLSVVGYYIAVLISKFNYKPVNETVRLLRKYNAGNDSFENDLDYVYKSIEQIGTSNQMLKGELIQHHISLQTKYLRDQLLRTFNVGDSADVSRFFEVKYKSEPVCVTVLEYLDYNALKKVFSDDGISKIRQEILTLLENNFNDITHDVLEINYQQIVLLSSGATTNFIRESVVDVLTQFYIEDKPIMVSAIGGYVDAFENAAASYEHALAMMEFKMISYETLIFEESSEINANNAVYYYPIDLEKGLINDVLLAKSDDVLNTIDNLLTMNFETRRLDVQNLSSFAFSITNTIYRICRQSHMDISDIFDDDHNVFLELKLCHNKEDFKDVMIKIFHRLLERIEGGKNQEHLDVIKRMIIYIEENYQKDLSLADVADRFNLSKGYVSGIFRQHSGYTFLDYLNRYRIKQAKQILNNTPEIKIKELAQSVGCNSSNTFIRLFKKYEGISPGEYQKSLFM